MLRIHVLNVGHGDSIVLEHEDNGARSFGVIDSNGVLGQDPPALVKLRALGAKRLSFVALTHPHADHFVGLHRILKEFDGEVGRIYTSQSSETEKD